MFVPTYEYQCDGCGRVFEVRQRISEAALTQCDVCGGTLKRLLSAAPFILKGEGWYVTDYPSESRKKALASEKSSGESAATKDSTTTEKSSSSEKSSSTTAATSTSAAAPSSSKTTD
jgi:putative FmdB family regulatory protein